MDWVQIATNLGVPVACMAVMAVAAWKVSIWAGERVVVPLVNAHLQFLASLENELKKQTEAYGMLSRILQQIGEKLNTPR